MAEEINEFFSHVSTVSSGSRRFCVQSEHFMFLESMTFLDQLL